MRIYYSTKAGGGFYPLNVGFQTNTIVRWLNEHPLSKPALYCERDGEKFIDKNDPSYGRNTVLVPWTKDPVHCLMLPDGRQWDTYNGWRYLASKRRGCKKEWLEWGRRAYQTMEEQQERDNGKDSNQKES